MRREEFSDASPGRIVSTAFRTRAGLTGADVHEERGWAFVPDPLPPTSLSVAALLPEVYEELAAAERNLSLLEGTARRLPNPHLLIGPFLRRDAIVSSAIENTYASARELALFEKEPDMIAGAEKRSEVGEVYNYVRAAEYGLGQDRPVSLNLIKEMHRILLTGVRGSDKRPGEFRDRQNAIGRDSQSFSLARFVPPPHAEVPRCMGELETFIHSHSPLPRLVRFALVHYQFEAIHPFLDGNGRLGRLLIMLLLCEQAQLSRPYVYISGYFEEHRNDYYDHLLRVSTHGAWIDWINFFLTAISTQAEDAIERTDRLLSLQADYQGRVREKRASANLPVLVDKLFESPSLTVRDVERLCLVGASAAGKLVDRLVERRILIEVTGRKWGRVFVAPEILDVIYDERLSETTA